MTCKCSLCGKTVHEISGYLHRVNEKGIEGIWECRPSCASDSSQQTDKDKVLLDAMEGKKQ